MKYIFVNINCKCLRNWLFSNNYDAIYRTAPNKRVKKKVTNNQILEFKPNQIIETTFLDILNCKYKH